MMRLYNWTVALSMLAATCPAFNVRRIITTTTRSSAPMTRLQGFDLSGNDWKPDSEKNKMGSTDTGDYFPEDWDPENAPDYTTGMYGSQSMLSRDKKGPALPGMENLGADAVLVGGLQAIEGIPPGMEFVASSVPDQTLDLEIASSSDGKTFEIDVKPICMTYEDFYAAFTPDSHPSFHVVPNTGRMDRRGGEPTRLHVSCSPNGQSGQLQADLVINLPEDNSKICYRFNVNAF